MLLEDEIFSLIIKEGTLSAIVLLSMVARHNTLYYMRQKYEAKQRTKRPLPHKNVCVLKDLRSFKEQGVNRLGDCSSRGLECHILSYPQRL